MPLIHQTIYIYNSHQGGLILASGRDPLLVFNASYKVQSLENSVYTISVKKNFFFFFDIMIGLDTVAKFSESLLQVFFFLLFVA